MPEEDFSSIIYDAVNKAIKELPDNKPEEDEFFDIPGLAEFLKCSVQTIHRYKKEGLPYYRTGRKNLFSKEQVLKFMRQKPRKLNY